MVSEDAKQSTRLTASDRSSAAMATAIFVDAMSVILVIFFCRILVTEVVRKPSLSNSMSLVFDSIILLFPCPQSSTSPTERKTSVRKTSVSCPLQRIERKTPRKRVTGGEAQNERRRAGFLKTSVVGEWMMPLLCVKTRRD